VGMVALWRLCSVFVALLIFQFSKQDCVRAKVFLLPPFPPLMGNCIMDAAFSFASSCSDESVCLIAGATTWLFVVWQPVLLCEGACRLRGCPSNGRVSEFESDRVLS
jgi:hypothetical protein